MLTAAQIDDIDHAFGVYDHDWRYYAEFLGEPFLLGDCLAYFDGALLYYCAFPLSDCRKPVGRDQVLRSVEDFPFRRATRGFDIWGRYEDLPPELAMGGAEPLSLVTQFDESTATDAVIDLASFSYDTNREARLACNAARNKNIAVDILRRERLNAEHIMLMEAFFPAHEISPLHASFYLAIPALMKNPNIYLAEARQDGILKGYAVLSLINVEAASMPIGFYVKETGSRAADAVFAAMIAWGQARTLRRLHVGYSETDSLRNFKRKWGAATDGPTYRESRFAADTDLARYMKDGSHPWRERIYQSVIAKNRTVA
ncbi:MAG: hypothetical protein WDO70_00745 [Alphaproteobacteria bacterium]